MIVILAIILRLGLMLFPGHSDMATFSWDAYPPLANILPSDPRMLYLIPDFAIALLLYLYFPGNKKALNLWLLNPVVLYGGYLFGQFDLIPTALYFCGMLIFPPLVGMGILFKTFPVFLILPYYRKSIKNIILALTPIIIAFLIMGNTLIGRLVPDCYESMNLNFIPFVCLYIVSFSIENRMKSVFVATMSLYSLFFVPIHYFIWIMPVMLIGVSEGWVSKGKYWICIASLFIYNFNANHTTTALLNLQPIQFSHAWGGIMVLSQMIFRVTCCLMVWDTVRSEG